MQGPLFCDQFPLFHFRRCAFVFPPVSFSFHKRRLKRYMSKSTTVVFLIFFFFDLEKKQILITKWLFFLIIIIRKHSGGKSTCGINILFQYKSTRNVCPTGNYSFILIMATFLSKLNHHYSFFCVIPQEKGRWHYFDNKTFSCIYPSLCKVSYCLRRFLIHLIGRPPQTNINEVKVPSNGSWSKNTIS